MTDVHRGEGSPEPDPGPHHRSSAGAPGPAPDPHPSPDQLPSPDLDRELEAVERFIADVQAGRIGTSQAMVAYREVHRPAIARLRAELDGFLALLAEDQPPQVTPPGG